MRYLQFTPRCFPCPLQYESDMRHANAMSALSPIADIYAAIGDVRFVPKADITMTYPPASAR